MYREERDAIARLCRDLVNGGLVVGTAGNVSVRRGDHIVISPSGVNYHQMGSDDIGVHDLDGNPVEARLRPSSELPLHVAIYAATPHTAIVHTHAPASTALSTVVDEVPSSHYYSAMFGGAVPVAPYATFGTDQLADNVTAALQGRTAALMGNHGAVLVGDDLDEVLAKVAYLEYICDVQLRAGSYRAGVRVLDAEEIARVADKLGGYGQVGGPRR